MKMNLTGAIEILKLHKHTTDKFKHSVGDQYVSDAIDTVVAYCEEMIQSDKVEFLKSAKELNEITHPYDLSKK